MLYAIFSQAISTLLSHLTLFLLNLTTLLCRQIFFVFPSSIFFQISSLSQLFQFYYPPKEHLKKKKNRNPHNTKNYSEIEKKIVHKVAGTQNALTLPEKIHRSQNTNQYSKAFVSLSEMILCFAICRLSRVMIFTSGYLTHHILD